MHSLPALIASKRARDLRPAAQVEQPLEVMAISNIIDTFHYHALIYYQEGSYKFIAITPALLNSHPIAPNKQLLHLLSAPEKPLAKTIQEYISAFVDPNYLRDEG